MARGLLYLASMTTTIPTLSSWLKTVHTHLEHRRSERRSDPRPKRNRQRERARREARALFRQYETEVAVDETLQ